MVKLNKILLVDDDYIDNFLNLQILEKLGLAEEIVVCESATEALQVAQENQPELIILDISMPIMTGLEFLVELHLVETQANLPPCSVVMLTSSSYKDDLVRAAELKVDYYLVKPLTEEKVRKMMERCFSAPGSAS
ncbi:MAG: response regulator [Bacteroidota bacterium]